MSEIEMCLCGTEVRMKDNVCPVCGRQYDENNKIIINETKLKDARIEPDQEKVKRIMEARKKLERSINFDEDD